MIKFFLIYVDMLMDELECGGLARLSVADDI